MLRVTTVLVILVLISHYDCLEFSERSSFSVSQSDKDILDVLTHPSRYDKRTKPQGPLSVDISVLLLSLSSPDESSLNYEVEFLVHQKWTDSRLVYSQPGSSKNYLVGLSQASQVWRPDIYLIKHGAHKAINPVDLSLKLFQNGTIVYSMRRHLVLNCEGDLPIFPFDSPMCSFNIESVSYKKDKLQFNWVGMNAVENDKDIGSMSFSPVLKNHNAHLIRNETLVCPMGEKWRGDYSCLKVRLHFTRDKWFYYTTVFVPGLILVTSSFVTFWIEWNAEPARVMLGVTTMLNFFTTSNKFRSKLPVVSSLTAMNLWDGVCMFFIYASFLEFILVNYLARWVQDPEQKKHNRDNAILDSLRLVSQSLDMTRKAVTSLTGMGGLSGSSSNEQTEASDRDSTSSSREGEGGRHSFYTLHNVKKIDNYSRRIFPTLYHLIEGALSVDYYYESY